MTVIRSSKSSSLAAKAKPTTSPVPPVKRRQTLAWPVTRDWRSGKGTCFALPGPSPSLRLTAVAHFTRPTRQAHQICDACLSRRSGTPGTGRGRLLLPKAPSGNPKWRSNAGISTKVLAIHLKSSHLRSRALQLLLVLPSQCLTVVSCDFPKNLCIHLASVTHISAQGRASLRELSRKGKLGKYAHISQVLGAFLWLPHVQSNHARFRSRLMAQPCLMQRPSEKQEQLCFCLPQGCKLMIAPVTKMNSCAQHLCTKTQRSSDPFFRRPAWRACASPRRQEAGL